MRKPVVNLVDAHDFFSPQVLAKILNIADARAYELVHREDFPKLKVGRKYLIPKAGFINWCERNMNI